MKNDIDLIRKKVLEIRENYLLLKRSLPVDKQLDAQIKVTDYILSFIDFLQEEPVSEDLGEYINELSKQFPEVSFAKLSRIAVSVSRWQQNQDVKNKQPKVTNRTELDEYAYQCAYDMSNDWVIENPTWHDVEDACKLGANWQKEQIMKGAIELPLYLDGDFLTVDYDFTESGFKVGDKVKLIIIKED